MMSTCPVCGRKHLIHWPEFWPYRRSAKLFCSEDCLIVHVTQENFSKYKGVRKKMARMKKDGTPAKKPGPRKKIEVPEKMPEVKLTGPIRIKTPDAKTVEIETPEASTLSDALNGIADAAADFFSECKDMGLNVDEPEAEPEEEPGEHYQTTALFVSGLGEFYHDRKYKCVDWRNDEGDEISLPPFAWVQLSKELPTILQRIGAIR